MAAPETKLAKLTRAAAAGDWRGALRIAAKFQDLGEHKAAIQRANQAAWNPGFYAQLGRSPDEALAAGIAALKSRYRI